MQVSVTFRNIESTDSLKDFAAEKVARIEKYIHTPTDAHIVLSVEKHLHKADITINGHGMMMRGKESTDDMYASIDKAMDKIERQVKRYRKKLSNHKAHNRRSANITLKYLTDMQEHEEHHDLPEEIVNTKQVEAKLMTVKEAMMYMDLINNGFYIFTNADTNEINVLYRREGGFGLFEAPAQKGGKMQAA